MVTISASAAAPDDAEEDAPPSLVPLVEAPSPPSSEGEDDLGGASSNLLIPSTASPLFATASFSVTSSFLSPSIERTTGRKTRPWNRPKRTVRRKTYRMTST